MIPVKMMRQLQKHDDFELFDIVQIVKHGYILFENSSYHEIKEFITDLAASIDDGKSGFCLEYSPVLCGSILFDNKGLTEDIQFYISNRIEVRISTIPSFCKSNVFYQKRGIKVIPFDKFMSSSGAVHVSFIRNMGSKDYDLANKECVQALVQLFRFDEFSNLTISSNWAEMPQEKPIYYPYK